MIEDGVLADGEKEMFLGLEVLYFDNSAPCVVRVKQIHYFKENNKRTLSHTPALLLWDWIW